MADPPAYGTTRQRREDVSYAEIERAATDILATGARPTVASLRHALKGGSPRTVLDGLTRFWKELGARVAGNPETLRRLPAAVADLADGVWQAALTEAAKGSGSATDAQLQAIRTETEVRAHALSLREIELDQLVRSRERTMKELEEHLRSTMSLVNKRDTTIESLTLRLAGALGETEEYRRRLAKVIERAVVRHQGRGPRKPAKTKTTRGRPQRAPTIKTVLRSKRPKTNRHGRRSHTGATPKTIGRGKRRLMRVANRRRPVKRR